MMLASRVEHQFVEFVPDKLEEATLYISIPYATVVHRCLCGCGDKVVTPLSPTDWRLGFNGVAVSLSPSVGNWSFPCQSHYWIRDGRVRSSGQWGREKIQAGRDADLALKRGHPKGPATTTAGASGARKGWSRIRRLLG